MSEKKKKVIRIVRRRAGDTDQMTGASEQALSSHDVASRPEPPRKARLREDDEQNAPTAAAVPVTEEPTSAEESTKRRVVRRKRISVVTKRSLSESQKQSEPQAAPEPAGDPPEALGGAVRKPMILDAPKPCKVQTPYEELLDSIYDAVLITDADASVIGVNQRAVDSLQYDQDDLLGMPLLTLLPDADIEFLKTLKQMPASKYALIETRCRRRDGSYYPAEIAVKSMGGRGNNIAFFVRNITRRREAEAQLSMVNNAVMNSLTAIVVTDEQGVIRFDNPAAIKIFRAASETRDNQKGLNLADFFIEKEKIESAFKDLRELKTWRGELRVPRPGGGSIDTEVSATPNIHDKKLDGFVFSVIDITTEKAARRQREINERNAATIAALGAACHHLSQPATVLCINAEILEQLAGHCEDPEMAELLRQNLEAVKDLQEKLRILNDMTHFRTEKYLEHDENIDDISNTILSIKSE
jgi:PAS domain S-box-containing protein